MPPAEPPPSPFAWGREERVVWGTYVNGFGPTKILAASLDAEKRAALERDGVGLAAVEQQTVLLAEGVARGD